MPLVSEGILKIPYDLKHAKITLKNAKPVMSMKFIDEKFKTSGSNSVLRWSGDIISEGFKNLNKITRKACTSVDSNIVTLWQYVDTKTS